MKLKESRKETFIFRLPYIH